MWRRNTFALILICSLVRASFSQGISIPSLTVQGMVFDHSGHLYFSNTDGFVRRYNISTKSIDAQYDFGQPLNGLDISPDDSFLLVGSGDPNIPGLRYAFFRLSLIDGAITGISSPSEVGGGGWDVAIAANNTALVTTHTFGAGTFTPLHQIDLTTNTVRVRNDIPDHSGFHDTRMGTRLSRSADYGTLLLSDPSEGYLSGGTIVYRADADSFGTQANKGSVRTAVNRNGTLLATSWTSGVSSLSLGHNTISLDDPRDNRLIHLFSQMGGAVAFDPTRDRIYGSSVYSNEVIAFDALSHEEEFRLPVGDYVEFPEYNTQFVSMNVSHDGKYVALSCGSGIRVFKVPTQPRVTEPPRFEKATDMVFDHAGNFLYIGTDTGYVWPYNLRTHQFTTPYYLGGLLRGMDIAADDSFILVAQFDHGIQHGTYHRINLLDGAVTGINYDINTSFGPELGSWDVAIAANGTALATAHVGGYSASVQLRQINTVTDTISLRTGQGTYGINIVNTPVLRSADRRRLVLPIMGLSDRPIYSYDSDTDTFTPTHLEMGSWGPSATVSRNGALFASSGNLESVPAFGILRALPSTANGGLAFDAIADVLYAVTTTGNGRGIFPSQIVAYDSDTFAEKFRIDVGEPMPNYISWQFDVNNLVASQDGKRLALTTPTTVRVFDLEQRTVEALPTPTPPRTNLGKLANISTRAFVGTNDEVPIAGFIIAGQGASRPVVVRGIGPSLSAAGVPNALQDPTLELHDASGAVIATNDNWLDTQGAEIYGQGLAPKDLRESAITANLNPGAYSVILRGKNGATGVGLVEVYALDKQSTKSELNNISTRALAGTGDNVIIAGVIVNKSDVRVMLRGIGPSLSAYNVPNPLTDPVLELHDSSGAQVAANDDWQDSKEEEMWNTGIPPLNPKESSIIASLNVGAYTAILRGKNETVGIGLVEVYYLAGP